MSDAEEDAPPSEQEQPVIEIDIFEAEEVLPVTKT